MLRKVLIVLVVVLLLSAMPVYAQDESPDLPLAAVSGNQIYVFGFGEPALVQTPLASAYNNLVWSPNGSSLAFTLADPNYFHSILVYTPGQPSATELVGQLRMMLPISFSADSSQIIYATPTGQMTENPMGSILAVQAIAPAAGAVPQTLGQFVFSGGCGGGSSIPADWLYMAETNALGGQFLTLRQTPYGVVHSTNCMGQGIGLLDLATGTDQVLDETMSKVVVSPDRTMIAGVGGDGVLTLIKLDTKERIALAAAAVPDQLTWGASGDIIYSTRASSGRQLVEGEAERLKIAQTLGYMDATGLDFPIWAVTIHRYNITDNSDTQVYASEAYAIGRMMESGGTLVFSEIPNLVAWAQAILDGSLDPMMGDSPDEFVQVSLLALNLTDNSVTVIGSNLNQAALNAAMVSQ